MEKCQVIVGYKDDFVAMQPTLATDAGLLYPGSNSQLLSECSSTPSQLVILDGTWHHTKTFERDIEWLHALPKYRLEPPSPSRYRIRQEPNVQSLSTLEATVSALRTIEPTTTGISQLLRAFDTMVEGQLADPRNPHAPGNR